MKLAITLLCENPHRPAGVSSMFKQVIEQSAWLYPSIKWTVFIDRGHEVFTKSSLPNVDWVTMFPGNHRLAPRLLVDHFIVGEMARRRGALALLTNGFVPANCPLPAVMHLLSLHHLDPKNQLSRLSTAYRGAVINDGVKRAKLVVTNSQFTANQITGATKIDPSKLFISNEGIDHANFSPREGANERARLKDRFGLDPSYVLCLSNLYPYKQSSLLVDAYARLPDELRRKHPLVFVGGNWNGQREVLTAQARTLGVADDVQFLGWVDDTWIPALYRQAGVHVLASREETWGRSVTEAMACGCPCLVNDIPVMAEVTQGQALITRFAIREEAAAALQQILTDEALRNRLRSGGIVRAAQLSFERLTRERIEKICEVLDVAVPHAEAARRTNSPSI
jgi:glycosyltransferase involved in cell wall biosynthesis